MTTTPDGLVLTDLLLARAAATPDAVAIEEVTGRVMTWQELLDETLRWADAYRRLGIGPGDRVATMMPNSADAYFAWLGVAWLGAVEVPLNTMYRGRMLEYVLRDCAPAAVVVGERFVDRIIEVAATLPDHRLVVPDAGSPLERSAGVVAGGAFFEDAGPQPVDGPTYRDVAAIIYTSGTTGPSKGVLVPWAELATFSLGLPAGYLPAGGGYYSAFPAFHVSGKNSLFNAALHDARLVLRETFSPGEFWDDVRRFDCTTAGFVGPMAQMLLLAPPTAEDRDHPLRSAAIGPLPPRLEEFKERFGVRVTTGYGMTEIGSVLGADWDLPNSRTCGRPRQGYPGYALRIVDDDDEPVGPNVVGELVVRADHPWTMGLGYWGMPDKTAEAWRNGWFHTGDGFLYDDDGWFYFVDRMKDAIRRRGENISSFEVEAFVNEHPAVQESAAVGVPSDLGEDEIKICVVLRPDASLTPLELVTFIEQRAPKFMVPRYVEIIGALPKTDATMRTRKIELRRDAFNTRTWDCDAVTEAMED